MSEQQQLEVYNLKQSCHQAEDALSQGMEKLQYILAETVAVDLLSEGNYLPQIHAAMDRFEALVRFVGQVIACAFLYFQVCFHNHSSILAVSIRLEENLLSNI